MSNQADATSGVRHFQGHTFQEKRFMNPLITPSTAPTPQRIFDGEIKLPSLPECSTSSTYSVSTSEGAALAGSLGVRGLLMSVEATHHEKAPNLITLALNSLRQDGVKRVHIFVDNEESHEAALRSGFEPREGESLYQLSLTERPSPLNTNLYPYVLRDGTAEDLVRLGLQLADIPELAFESWELPLMFTNIGKSDRFFKVVEVDGHIVGISVGGSANSRGTISHTWVAQEHRGHGLGNALSDASLLALYDSGARDIHLMTVAGNTTANRFWEHQGFERATIVQFLEIDL